MRQNTNGRGELLNFLKGETHDVITWTKEIDMNEVQRYNKKGDSALAVAQQTYELSGLDGNVTDPIMVDEPRMRKRFTFKNVIQTGPDEAIAETMEIEQL